MSRTDSYVIAGRVRPPEDPARVRPVPFAVPGRSVRVTIEVLED